MKNRNIIIVIAGIASVLFICIGFYMMNYTKLDNREILLLEYGDTFPTDHLYNADDSTYIPDNRYYIYVYLSKHCGSCLENFSSISKLFKIYQTPELTIKIIWEEETPYFVLRIREVTAKSRLDGRERMGYLDTLRYEEDSKLVTARSEDNRIFIPLSACVIHHYQEGSIVAKIPITVTSSVGRQHMPESTALLLFWL